MSKPDVIVPVVAGNIIQNGSIVVLTFESGQNSQTRTPDVNHHMASGVIEDKYAGRFDDVDYYG